MRAPAIAASESNSNAESAPPRPLGELGHLESIPAQSPIEIEDPATTHMKAVAKWHYRPGQKRVPSTIRLDILKAALKALAKIVNPNGRKLKVHGLFYTWHYQVFLFLPLQSQQEQKAWTGPRLFTGMIPLLDSRKVQARKVVTGGGWGTWICRRIIRQEVSWVRRDSIPQPKQGNYGNIVSMLEDADTIRTVCTYINSIGDSKSSSNCFVLLFIKSTMIKCRA